jgi:arylsulfatase A-like enzyme
MALKEFIYFNTQQIICMENRNSAKPNILVVLVDDMGYSDAQPFGGEASMPHVQALADNGISFRHAHTSSLCAPTRSMLLTGVDNHQNGLGVMPPMHAANQYKQPGYEGYLNDRVITIAQILKDSGYHTFMAGKWHLGFPGDQHPANEGFERSFALIGGGARHWADALPLSFSEVPVTYYVEDEKRVGLPQDFYSSTFYADKLIQYLSQQTDDKPFFGYLAFTAPHDPLHVPDGWINNYRGVYNAGYDALKKQRLQKMKDLGLLKQETLFNNGDNRFGNWEALSDEEKKMEARKMEIYTAMLECLDHELGRVVAHLKETGKFDNTIIFFLSDNGANPKTPEFYAGNTKEQIARDYNNSIDNMGRPHSFVSIGPSWAEVANTPLSYFKLTSYEGGTQTPLIVSGQGVKARGINHTDLLHVTDLVPTVLELTGASRPASYNGVTLAPLYGKSYAKILKGETDKPLRNEEEAIGFEMIECKSLIKGGWKVLFEKPPYGDGIHWHLYNLKEDELEQQDLSGTHPEKTKELVEDWQAYARSVGYIEANGPSQLAQVDSPMAFYKSL